MTVRTFAKPSQIVLLPVLTLLFAGFGFACTCYGESHYKTFRKADAVFTGRLLSVEAVPTMGGNFPNHIPLLFDIGKRWKGPKEVQMLVYTNESTMCSAFEFREGNDYLLYAYRSENNGKLFVTSECASSQESSSQQARKRMRDLNSYWFRLKSRWWRF